MSNVVQLSKTEHKNTKLIKNRDFSHVAEHHITPVIVHEVANAAADLPVAFIKNSESGDYMLVALLGFKEKENLLVDSEGRWIGAYIPAAYTHYPLSIATNAEDQGRYTVTLDQDSPTVNEKEGDPLFNEDGSESEYLTQRRQALENYYQCAITTREFIKTLVDMDILIEQGFNFQVGEEKRTVTGIYMVDEQKFNELPSETFIELRDKGFLGPIYAHLISLKQTQRLVNLVANQQNS